MLHGQALAGRTEPQARTAGEPSASTWPAPINPYGGELTPAASTPARPQPVVAVRIVGNETVGEDKVLSYLRTRTGRQFDPELVQADKRRLASSGLFRDVRIYTQPAQQGVTVTFEVFERPTIRYVKFIGNRGIGDKALLKESGLKVGEALNFYTIEEARRKIEDFYRGKGFAKARVEILEGNDPQHRGAVFNVSEGPLQRISSVDFVGNTIASDARLTTQIQSKPGIFWYFFRGKVDRSKIEEDIDRLTAYYRSLGYFRARIGRELAFDDAGKWLTLRFVVDEGPRYKIRNVSVLGNEQFGAEEMAAQLELASGDYFDLAKMNRDVNTLRDLYGSQGHIFADVKADPRFLEEPGQLDLVYNVEEGDQFRVGRINVHIAGEYPHTRETVVLDRLSIRPGDIVDIREVRASERRLKSSQLFENDPANGKAPRIVVRPPDLSEGAEVIARDSGRRAVRGQSPDPAGRRPATRTVDLHVYVIPLPGTWP